MKDSEFEFLEVTVKVSSIRLEYNIKLMVLYAPFNTGTISVKELCSDQGHSSIPSYLG